MPGFSDPWADEILPTDAVRACRSAVAEAAPFFCVEQLEGDVHEQLGTDRCEQIGTDRLIVELRRQIKITEATTINPKES